MIYLLIVFLLIILLIKYDIRGYERNRDFWYHIVLAILILVAGLRYRLGIDTQSYLYDYFHSIPTINNLKADDLRIGKNPFWILLNSLFLSLGCKFYVVQLVESAFVNILLFKYIRKHSQYIFTCVFFYFIWMYFSYSMEAMKAGFSMVLCLFAHDYILIKKWQKAFSLFLIAFLFHPSVILIAFFSVMTFLRFNHVGLLLLCLTYSVTTIIQDSYGDLIMLFSYDEDIYNKAESYGSGRFFENEGDHNIKYYIAHYFSVIVSSIVAFWYVKKNKRNSLIKLEPYLYLGVVFAIMSAIIIIFFRIYYFYVVYIILFISQSLIDFIKKPRSYGKLSVLSHFLIFSLFILYIYFSYGGNRWMRYYPYSSVIEKSVNNRREKLFREQRTHWYYPNVEQY